MGRPVEESDMKVRWLVVLGVVAVVTVMIVRFASQVRRGSKVDLSLGAQVGRPPTEWLAEAEGHERAGRWREALRCRYRLLLARLAAIGLVDEVPLLAVLASRAEGETVFREVGELRVKESDRLSLIASNLRNVGALAEVVGNDLHVQGGDTPPRGRIRTEGP